MEKFTSGLYEGSVSVGKLKYLSTFLITLLIAIFFLIFGINTYFTNKNTVNVLGTVVSSNCRQESYPVYNNNDAPSSPPTIVTNNICSNLIEYTRDNVQRNTTIVESIYRETNSQVALTYNKTLPDDPQIKSFEIIWYWIILISVICFGVAYFNYYVLTHKDFTAAVGVEGALGVGQGIRNLFTGK